MRDSGVIDETDLAIIHAVERAPRAPWALLAGLIGVDAGTAARRWQRLQDSGIAWVGCYPLISPDQVASGIEITCAPGTATAIALAIAHDPQVQSVDLMTGSSDILATVFARNRRALSDYVLERLSGIRGVTAVHAHPIVGIYSEGGFAAADGLPLSLTASLPTRSNQFSGGSSRESDDVDWQICVALNEDGRRPFSELATITGISEASVRRRMTRLTDSGALRMMVGLASDAAPAPHNVWYRLKVAPKDLPTVAVRIAALPNIRAAVSVAGPHNLIVKAAFRQLAHMGAFEVQLNNEHPSVEISDRNVVLRPTRLRGRIVDANGYATGVAPIDIRDPQIAVVSEIVSTAETPILEAC